ncbi:hypothetical protein [Mesoplasma florum]|uniref:hypothetical protein n=1 Tax=Mesoplasma florum TaxID=2151 RepID=UPI0011822D99
MSLSLFNNLVKSSNSSTSFKLSKRLVNSFLFFNSASTFSKLEITIAKPGSKKSTSISLFIFFLLLKYNYI